MTLRKSAALRAVKALFLLFFGSLLFATPGWAAPQAIAHFDAASGGSPFGGLIRAGDGNFYGLSVKAGAGGTLFRVTPAGARTTIGSYPCSLSGTGCNFYSPFPGGLLQGTDGNFYFFVDFSSSISQGGVYRMTPGGTLTLLLSFDDQRSGGIPAGLVQGANGSLYGTTNEGVFGGGIAYRLTMGGVFTTLFTFAGSDGEGPGRLVSGGDGNFYGTTGGGGARGLGTFFRLTPAGTVTTLASFDGTNGRFGAGLTLGRDGTFYANSFGSILHLTRAGAITVLADAPGSTSPGVLLESTSGNFYFVTGAGNNGGGDGDHGILYSMSPAGSLTPLANFNAAEGFDSGDTTGEGYTASGPLVEGDDGSIYGTTGSWSVGEFGTVFRFAAPGLTLNAVASLHQISLTWTFVTGATSYNLYQGTTPGGEGSAPVQSLPGTGTVLTGVANGTYYFQVAAVGPGGEGVRSAEVSALVNTPDPFSFVSVFNVPRKTHQISNAVTITGLVAPAPISVENGVYSINRKAFTKAPGMIQPGDRVRLRHMSSSFAARTITTTVTIGGVSASFSSRTAVPPP